MVYAVDWPGHRAQGRLSPHMILLLAWARDLPLVRCVPSRAVNGVRHTRATIAVPTTIVRISRE